MIAVYSASRTHNQEKEEIEEHRNPKINACAGGLQSAAAKESHLPDH